MTGQGVDITLLKNSTPGTVMLGRKAGGRLVGGFGGIILASALDCGVVVLCCVAVTNDLAHSIPVTLSSNSNTTPIPVPRDSIRMSNTPEQAIPVLFGGTVEPVLGFVTIDNIDAEAILIGQKAGHVFVVEQATEVDTRPYLTAAVNDRVPVAVAAVVVVLVAVSTTRRGLRIKNAGAAAVAIGGATLAYATAAVLIQPSETWNENEAPGAAWWCVCDAAQASTLNVQEIT